jgi:hypothetical protein
MRAGGAILKINKDTTWRIAYQACWPSTLTATTKFTHIMQLKVPDIGGPLWTLTPRQKSTPRLTVLTLKDNDSSTEHDLTSFSAPRNKWIDLEFEFKASGELRHPAQHRGHRGRPGRQGVQGTVLSNQDAKWVFAKPLVNGDGAVALFNEGSAPAKISTSAAALVLPRSAGYALRDLWQHKDFQAAGQISEVVAPHATVRYRVK